MSREPVEPPPTPWILPSRAELAALPASGPGPDGREDGGEDGTSYDGSDLVAIGADLEPGTLLAAYRTGLFPMPEGRSVGWWSPAQRGVLRLDELRVSRSLRRSARRFEIRVDTAFEDVLDCRLPARLDLQRFSRPEEVAYAVLYLASDEASNITGIVLRSNIRAGKRPFD